MKTSKKSEFRVMNMELINNSLFCTLHSSLFTFLKLGLITLLALSPSIGNATNKKVGTTGAQFLKIGVGARPTSMSGAFTGVADDINAVYYNPAGLATISRPEILGMRTQWLADMSYDFGAFAYPTDYGAFALSVATLKVDDLQRRSTDESYGGTFGAMDAAYGLSYARNFGPLMSMGLTARNLRQEIDGVSATTWSGDLGILRRFVRLPISVGLAARNFGQSVEFRRESDPLPFTIDAGVGASFLREKLLVSLDAKFPRDNTPALATGVEMKVPMGRDIRMAFRGGFSTAGVSDDDRSGFSLGAGFGVRKLDVDFSFVPMGDLGNTYRYSLRFRF